MSVTSSWTRYCALTIDNTKVTSDQSDLPVLLTAANLPSEMITSGGANACNSDGSDIRITTDLAGATECPLEVVVCTLNATPANSLVEVHTKIPSVSSTVSTVFYVWYHNPAATAYGNTDTYGRNNVWANYAAVWHFQVITASSASVVDSVGTCTNGTPGANITTGTGVVQNGVTTYDEQEIVVPDNATIKATNLCTSSHGFTLESFTYFPDAYCGGAHPSAYYAKWPISKGTGNNKHYTLGLEAQGGGLNGGNGACYYGTGGGTGQTVLLSDNNLGITINTWGYLGLRFGDTTNKKYQFERKDTTNAWVAETEKTYVTAPDPGTSTQDLNIGDDVDWPFIHGGGMIYDEIRISIVTRAESFMRATYETVRNPSTFLTAGTPASNAGVPRYAFVMFQDPGIF